MEKALLINLEGPDGAGKSTQGLLLTNTLAAKGIASFIDHEPTKGNFGRMIKIILRKETTAEDLITETKTWFRESMESCFAGETAFGEYYSELLARAKGVLRLLESGRRPTGLDMQFLFFLDRFFDIRDFINPNLERGIWIIADRYSLSSGAYGFGQHGIPVAEIFALENKVLGQIYRRPDLKVYLDLSAPRCLERLKNDGREIDIFETLYGIERTIQGYREALHLKQNEGGLTCIINADDAIEAVAQKVLDCVRKVFKFNYGTSPI